MSAEEGEIRCDETGVCKYTQQYVLSINILFYIANNLGDHQFWPFNIDVVEFDNSFSYFRSKKIWYLVTVELPSINKKQ